MTYPMRVPYRVLAIFLSSFAIAVVANGAAPIAYHATYEVSIESDSFKFSFDWSEYDYHGWSFGQGSYTARHLTDCCFAQLLTPKWAVIVRLPGAFSNNPSPTPEIILVDRNDTAFIRCYKDLEPGKIIDGLFSLRTFTLSSESGRRVDGKMSDQERHLLREIDEGRYATLYGCAYDRSQWEQSAELNQQLGGLRQFTLLGHPQTDSRPDGFRGFYRFTSQFIWNGKKGAMKPHRVLFEQRGEIWSESGSKVATYKRGQFTGIPRAFAPYRIENKGLKFNLSDNSLYYDPESGRLTLLLARSLETFAKAQFENPPGPL